MIHSCRIVSLLSLRESTPGAVASGQVCKIASSVKNARLPRTGSQRLRESASSTRVRAGIGRADLSTPFPDDSSEGPGRDVAHHAAGTLRSRPMRIPVRVPAPADRPFDVVTLGLNSVDLVTVVAEYPASNSK